MPSFWLDEACVAVSLRNPAIERIFSRLEYGLYFPRFYLATLAAFRHFAGYHIWSLRLLPLAFFAVATLLWARILFRLTKDRLVLVLLAGALMLGSIFWLDQSIQLKQYTMDVMFALLPFVVTDEVLDGLQEGRNKWMIVLLCLPCIFSYTYPLALGARVLGWYLLRATRGSWRVNPGSLILFAGSVCVAMGTLWVTDLRFNAADLPAYAVYWSDCLLNTSFQRGLEPGIRLLARFLWGWHGRQPIVTALVIPLQAFGLWSIYNRFRRSRQRSKPDNYDARLVGSLVLLGSLLVASAVGIYPICAGRVTLFAQVHIQLVTVEGAAFVLQRWAGSRIAATFIVLTVTVFVAYSVRDYTRFMLAEPAENIRAMTRYIDPQRADRLWVQSCSIPQVRSLPDRIPVSELLFGDQKDQTKLAMTPGEPVWILWSHMGNLNCVDDLAKMKSRARSWQVVAEGQSRGLALAEF
jgi:hypothetical protein